MSNRTSLHDAHVALGAKMVDFAGWSMPIQYAGLLDEHRSVRGAAGLFDLGHMAQLSVSGPGAAEALDAAVVSAEARLAQAKRNGARLKPLFEAKAASQKDFDDAVSADFRRDLEARVA